MRLNTYKNIPNHSSRCKFLMVMSASMQRVDVQSKSHASVRFSMLKTPKDPAVHGDSQLSSRLVSTVGDG